ncbi:hypothetical protein OAE84_01140 [bacterium]|nr:hypothetical protein [bacterium]
MSYIPKMVAALHTAVLIGIVLLAGCSKSTEVTFSQHIAPILQAKCQTCHRPGQIAPMPFLTFRETRPFAELIRLAVNQGSMPPFYADGPLGYYKDDIRLTAEEKQLINAWADAGAPEGDPAYLPELIQWDPSGWPFGEPDFIVEFPRYSPRTDAVDDYITFVTEPAFRDDLWVSALHLRFETTNVVHHSSQLLWPPNMKVPEGGKTLDHPNQLLNPLFTWTPGFKTVRLPPGQALRLNARHRIASTTHFAPTVKEISEKMQLGIYYANGEVHHLLKNIGASIRSINIPPGDANWTASSKATFKEDALISHFRVHMHLRGKSSRIVLHYPDGTSETVFDLPRFRFEWQRYYYLNEPKHVPKGTVAEFIGVWDNSSANPSNPDPTVWCRWGLKSTNEMFGSNIFYTSTRKLPVPVVIEKGLQVGGPKLRNHQLL